MGEGLQLLFRHPISRLLLSYGVATVYAADLKSSLRMHTPSIAETYIGPYAGEYANVAQVGLIVTLIFVIGPWLASRPGGGGNKKDHTPPGPLGPA